MEKWKEHIIEGNKFFKSKEFDKAISSYEHSKDRVKMLFDEWFNPEEVIAGLLASYHNISELHIQNNQKYLSFLELQKARTFLNQKAENIDPNCHRWFLLQKGIDKNEVEILSFMKKHRVNAAANSSTLMLQNKLSTKTSTQP